MENNKVFIINKIAEINNVAKQFLDHYGDHKIFAFYGEMGSGKTTFIKALCKHLCVKSITKSPTFSIINIYNNDDKELYHFDCYRIENITDFINIGYEEYFNSGNYCFIEWAEKIEEVINNEVLKIKISVNEHDNSRVIYVL